MESSTGAVNVSTAAQTLGVSPATARNWIKSGFLPARFKQSRYSILSKDIAMAKARLLSSQQGRLRHRANKIRSQKTFVPTEYMSCSQDRDRINRVLLFAQKHALPVDTVLFFTALNLLNKCNIVTNLSIKNIGRWSRLRFSNQQIKKELSLWHQRVPQKFIKSACAFLIETPLPMQQDGLGAVYQSSLKEGGKSSTGSYYTPVKIVRPMVQEYLRPGQRAMDPCCGTGQFLLAFCDRVDHPCDVYGFDCDPMAIQIARLNVLLKFKNKNFRPNIFCKNALVDAPLKETCSVQHDAPQDFHFVATNPPWGAQFSTNEMIYLNSRYAHIQSKESFSYFISKSFEWLAPGGVASFILPEAVLNVKAHKDIRLDVLKKFQIQKVIYCDRVFKNVFTPVIRLDLKKTKTSCHRASVQVENAAHENVTYKADQKKWLKNKDYVFNIQAQPQDLKIIDKIYSMQHTNLQNQAQWALGIVTGNNNFFLSPTKKKGWVPIYRGKDVKPFCLAEPLQYINLQPHKFQQMAPEHLYRSREKLIYRFISKKLVFAYDGGQNFTLNSANIVKPHIANYPTKVVAALFNSSAYQFIFQKKFSSIKVLRSHLEQLPLPLWSEDVYDHICKSVDAIIEKHIGFYHLDNDIMDALSLSIREKKHIWKSID